MNRQQRITLFFSLVLVLTVVAVLVGLSRTSSAPTYDSPLAPAPGLSPLDPVTRTVDGTTRVLLWVVLGGILGGGIALLFVHRERQAA
jgi:predicted cobalt transporter CbtA